MTVHLGDSRAYINRILELYYFQGFTIKGILKKIIQLKIKTMKQEILNTAASGNPGSPAV